MELKLNGVGGARTEGRKLPTRGKNRRAPYLILHTHCCAISLYETSGGTRKSFAEGPSNIHAPDKEDAAVAFYAFLCSESPTLVLFVPFKLGGICSGVSLEGS